MRHIAVMDIGKTNAKLALVDLADLAELAVRTRPNTVLQGPPWPHYDLAGLWRFFCDGLRDLHQSHGIDGISVTTHGAAVTLIGADGQPLPMLDYEHPGPDETAARYTALRPGFAQTGSPRLPMGLNLGAQLHWMFATQPDLRAQTRHIVTYPQYWGYRLTGNLACDVTSLGCHTDLWLPASGQYSDLVDRLQIRDLIAPARRPDARLGGLSARAAAETGLPQGVPVAAGIHDSNASLLPHLMTRKGAFSVVSTGTWVIAMAMGGDAPPLDPARDTLINVNAFGAPVPSARFMGGREFDMVNDGWNGEVTDADRQTVRDDGIVLLPAVAPGSGPFAGRRMRWTRPPQTPAQRRVALSYYLAMMTQTSLAMIGAQGPCLVEGPFARNADYLTLLATMRPGGVAAKTSATGTSAGAALLLASAPPALPPLLPATPDPALAAYAARWRALVDAP